MDCDVLHTVTGCWGRMDCDVLHTEWQGAGAEWTVTYYTQSAGAEWTVTYYTQSGRVLGQNGL